MQPKCKNLQYINVYHKFSFSNALSLVFWACLSCTPNSSVPIYQTASQFSCTVTALVSLATSISINIKTPKIKYKVGDKLNAINN